MFVIRFGSILDDRSTMRMRTVASVVPSALPFPPPRAPSSVIGTRENALFFTEPIHGPTDQFRRWWWRRRRRRWWRWRSYDRRPGRPVVGRPSAGRPSRPGDPERQWPTNRRARRSPKRWTARAHGLARQSTVAAAPVARAGTSRRVSVIKQCANPVIIFFLQQQAQAQLIQTPDGQTFIYQPVPVDNTQTIAQPQQAQPTCMSLFYSCGIVSLRSVYN